METPRITLRRGVVLGLTVSLVIGGSVAGAKRHGAKSAAVPVEMREVVPDLTRPALTKPRAASFRLDESSIAIPVVGITPEQLRDTWGAARSGGRSHEAIDILSERGTPAVAAVEGVVLKLYQSDAGGTTIYLSDMDGKIVYYYAHLDRYVAGLTEGDLVERGEVLGYVGTTGNAPANAPHLHFSIERLPPSGEWWKGEPLNPYPVLLARGYTVD